MEVEFNINKNSHIPIFFQIQKQIRKKIEESDLEPGTQLPTERNLSEKLDVSRVTIRKAIRGLIAEGYCEKKVGKGIFVSNNKIPTNVHNLEGTTEFLQETDLKTSTKVIRQKTITPSKKLQKKLKIDKNDIVLFLERLRLIRQEPVMLEKTYLPLKQYPDIKEEHFENSLYQIIRKKYDLYPNHAKGFFNILMATENESNLLNIQLNTPILVKEAVVYTIKKQILEYNMTYFRTDKFKFIVDSKINS